MTFEEFATGRYTRADVLKRVTALGLRTRRGARLSPQTLHALFRNRLYTGRIVVPSLGIDVPGDFPPIVSTELFNRVQGLLAVK